MGSDLTDVLIDFLSELTDTTFRRISAMSEFIEQTETSTEYGRLWNNITVFSLEHLVRLIKLIEPVEFENEGFAVYLAKRVIGVILNVHKFAAALLSKIDEPQGKIYVDLVHRLVQKLMTLSEDCLEHSFMA